MSTWLELVAHLGATQHDVRTFPDDRARFTYDHAGAAVPVGTLHLASPSGAAWIGLAIKLGAADQLRERSALVANVDLPIGGLAIIGDQAVLRQTLPLPFSHAVLAHTLAALATLRSQLHHAATVAEADLDLEYAYLFR